MQIVDSGCLGGLENAIPPVDHGIGDYSPGVLAIQGDPL